MWYRSGVVKGILVVIAHILAVILTVSMLWILAYPGALQDTVSGEKAETYSESEGFTQQVFWDMSDILHNIALQDQMETDGKYDGTRIVDIQEYSDHYTISDENKSGLAYTLDHLNQWGEAMDRGDAASSDTGSTSDNPIIVCLKPDNTYEYFYYSELKGMIEAGELSFIMENGDYTAADILNMLKNGSVYPEETAWNLSAVQDGEGRVKYIDCWNYDGYWMQELYAPEGAKDLLEIVNTNPNWNGRLSEVFAMVRSSMVRIASDVDSYETRTAAWQEGNTNLAYVYADTAGKKVFTNREAYETYDKLEETLDYIRSSGKYMIVMPRLVDFESNMNGTDAKNWVNEIKYSGTAGEDFVFAVNVDTKFPIEDGYAVQNEAFERTAPWIRVMFVWSIISVIFLLVIIVWLTVVAGRVPEDDEIHLHPFDRWKTELAAGCVIGVWAVLFSILAAMWPVYNIDYGYQVNDSLYYAVERSSFYELPEMLIAGGVALLTCAAFLVGYLSLVRRIKAKSLWKNSLLRWLIHFTVEMFQNSHSVWKTVLVFTGFLILHWAAMGSQNGMAVFLMFIAEILAFIYVVRRSAGRKRICRGVGRIARGEVDYKIPLAGLYGEQLEIAGRINTIGEGLDAAVEKSMKSERLKTDLITNVSHDIKTPLTSIINYVDLLKRENFADPKIIGYLDILEAKAQRLKTLTEDVVEASKVSSGNISLEYMDINLTEMIQQLSGEFEEKFKSRGLNEVLSLPAEEVVIRVDGRRMWRVFENVYNNAAKYAMEGTRVYVDLFVAQNEAIFSIKNVSEQPLNIQADELTERFIRGDVSRSTEGSGLGLSIAKSLTEMQGGVFELYLDGDLFKVTIKFPKV